MDEKDDAIHLYDESRKGTLIFVFITLPGRRAVSFLGKGLLVDMIFIIYCKNIMRMMDVILLYYHIMRSEMLHPDPPILTPTDNV